MFRTLLILLTLVLGAYTVADDANPLADDLAATPRNPASEPMSVDCEAARDTPATSPPYSGVIGFTLPNDASAHPTLAFGGVQVGWLNASGCAADLARLLRKTDLLSDESCKLLLTHNGDELSVLHPHNLVYGARPQQCGRTRIAVSPGDFVKIHSALSHHASANASPSGCKPTGQICHSSDAASFEIGCKDETSFGISTNGPVTLSGSVGSLKFGIQLTE